MNRAFYPSDPLQSATPMKLDFDSFELAGCHSRVFPSCFDAHSTGAGDCRIGATARRKAGERQSIVPVKSDKHRLFFVQSTVDKVLIK